MKFCFSEHAFVQPNTQPRPQAEEVMIGCAFSLESSALESRKKKKDLLKQSSNQPFIHYYSCVSFLWLIGLRRSCVVTIFCIRFFCSTVYICVLEKHKGILIMSISSLYIET